MWALRALIQYEVMGQRARFERFSADMLFVIASGERIDKDRAPHFADILEKTYANPFEKKQNQPMTAAEIKQYILEKLEA